MFLSFGSRQVADAAQALQGDAAVGAAVGIVILLFVLVVLALIVLTIAGRWKMFKKAGMPGWAALIPVYDSVKSLQLGNRPLWWIVPMAIPGVGIIFQFLMLRRVAGVFGRGWWFTMGLLFLPFIFYPILGFGRAEYRNSYPPARPLSEAVLWTLLGIGMTALVCIYWAAISAGSATGIHPLTIIGDPQNGYATDGRYVYESDTIVPGADPFSFDVEGDWAMDARHVYYNGAALPNIDVGTFKVLDGGAYASDGSSVYYDGSTVDGADPKTFRSLDSTYGKDSQNVYAYGSILSGADPKTFVLETGTLGKSVDYDARDANHYYYSGERVQ